ncbi:MAG: hypothetical protein RI959_1908 [Pseudomonadota bacterium]|jgi:hypothetical protein
MSFHQAPGSPNGSVKTNKVLYHLARIGLWRQIAEQSHPGAAEFCYSLTFHFSAYFKHRKRTHEARL